MSWSRTSLLDTYRGVGRPTATIYLPTPSATEDAAQRADIVRKNALKQLSQLGAPTDLKIKVERALDDIDHGSATGRVLVVTTDDVRLDATLERPIARQMAHLGPCPALMPLLAATQVDVEHLAVLLDRTGADVLVRRGVSDPIDSTEIEGSSVRVHRGHPGGWSQKRFQQTAENAWEDNAKEVVDAVVDDHRDIDLVICGGDVRAVGFFTHHLPNRCDVHVVDGSRHADPDAFLDEVDTVLRSRSADAIVELIEDWRQAKAAGTGSTGVATLTHLATGRVEHLLVVDDTTDPSRATQPFAFDAAVHPVPADSAPPDSAAAEAAITDAAVAMAVATGADVTVVPSTPDIETGLGAVLRY